MQIFLNPKQASHWCQQQRQIGKRIGFVATMGALHEGHLTLVRKAKRENDLVCVSIFVNPLQFNNPQDLAKYPRTFDTDSDKLISVGTDMIFTGELTDFFNSPADMNLPIPIQSQACLGLEADFRPGHFEGVWKIVDRLFRTVGECRAYFGQKDFQQVMLVKELAQYLGDLPRAQQLKIDVIDCATVRETTGLALSSRNRHLNTTQRKQALVIYNALKGTKEKWQLGERNALVLEEALQKYLNKHEFEYEYAAIRDPELWSKETPNWPLNKAQALIAGYIGNVRLIDNMSLNSST